METVQAVTRQILPRSATDISAPQSVSASGKGLRQNAREPTGRYQQQLEKLREGLETKEGLEARLQSQMPNVSGVSDRKAAEQGNKEPSMMTEKERQKWKEEWQKKADEAANFAEKMRQEQKERKRREGEKQKLLLDKLETEQQTKQREAEERAKADEERRKTEAEQKKEEFERKRQERLQLIKLANEKVPKKTYLYQKMNDQYVSEMLMPELEKRKQQIAQKRNIYKPIHRTELQEHERRFDEAIQKSEEERRREREKARMDSEDYLRKAQEYQTVFTENVIKHDQESKNRMLQQRAQLKEAYAKKMTYAKIVKESCPPKVSELKALELKKCIEGLKHVPKKLPHPSSTHAEHAPVRRTLTGKGTSIDATQAEHQSDHGSGQESAPRPKQRVRMKLKHTVNSAKGSGSIQPERRSQDAPELHDMHVHTKKHTADYLAEQRKKRENSRGVVPHYENLLRQSDLSVTEKYHMLKAQADMIDQNARRKEQLMSVKGELQHNQDAGQEVSDMYINAIKAKLSLLEL
jgi:hypothetical protein